MTIIRLVSSVPFEIVPSMAVIAAIAKSDGLFTATGTDSGHGATVGKTPAERAAIPLAVAPLFAMLFGALGSMVNYTFSFLRFVGNPTVRWNWFRFSISKQFVGAVRALIRYFIGGSYVISGTERYGGFVCGWSGA